MSIQSGRQFRSYIISWFLMIVGLIVVLGAIAIFERAQDYLLTQYKNNKQQQLLAMVSLIDSQQHATLQANQTSDDFFQRLARTFKGNNQTDISRQRIYSLNFDAKQKRLVYAVDPQTVANDSIHVASDYFNILLQKKDQGFYIEPLPIPGEYGAKLSNATLIELRVEKKHHFLQVNGQQILQLTNPAQLAAEYQNQAIDIRNRRPLSAKVEIPQPTRVEYRYLVKEQPLHLPGSEFFAEPQLKEKLFNSIKQSQPSLLSATEDNIVSDLLIVVPLLGNTDKKILGAVIMEIPAATFKAISEEFLKSVLLIFSLMGVLILIAAIFFARKITTPLEQLNLAIARLIHNDFNFKLSTKGFGSFRFLAEQFNQMLKHIQQGRNEMISLNKSYSRFVPHQLLKQLSSSGVVDIALGDCCEREMTVLFCDIRGFTTLSESMTPQANFNFINRYLSQIAPVINKRGGIIDKYLGDGIMALFPNGADEALKAAIEMLQALDVYNQRLKLKNLPVIEVGLGLHSGRMMLGTVGTSSRMDATVVSDTVNAAARVESMTKAFCTKILITEETKRKLVDLPYYRMRYIASCSIQGKSKQVTLYEVFNSDPVSLQKEKAANQSTMIRAWKCYKNGDIASAIALYQRLIEKSPDDKSLFALIERCQSGRL